ncbi:unnamed protein product [Penicillium pancosmium]
MAPYTRQSRRTGDRIKSGTALSKRAHLMSPRTFNSKAKSPFTASKSDGSVVGFKFVEQPKTILRIRLRRSAHEPSVSLATSSRASPIGSFGCNDFALRPTEKLNL